MAENEVFNKVREILCDQLDLSYDDVTEDATIMEGLDADSLDLHDLRGTIEEEFDVEISEKDAETLITVEDLVGYIEDHME